MFPRFLACGLAFAVMAGCASSPNQKELEPLSQNELTTAIAQALQTAQDDDLDLAVEKLTELAQRNPSSGLAWSHIAKLRFDHAQYGAAIVAADETLQREPDDFTAKSVRVVGGLRIALQSLADIRDNALLAGNARVDAQALAQALRDSLGQDALFPKERKPAPRRARAKPAEARPAPAAAQDSVERTADAAPAPTAAPAAGPAAVPKGGTEERNPFSGLLNVLSN